MKPHRKQDFALGLAALAFIALFLATVLFLYPALRQTAGKRVVVYFRHEEGLAPLQPGSAVLLADSIQVGQVSSIYIDQVPMRDASRRRTVFVVELQIQPHVPLYGNAEITTNQPAIGGPGYVSILNVGTADVPAVGPIEGLPPQSLAFAISSLSRRLLGADGLVDRLSQAVDPHGENSIVRKVLVSLDDLNVMTAQLRGQMSPVDEQALLHKLHAILDDFNVTTASLREQLSAGNDAALLARLHVALNALNDGLADAAGILRENRPVVRDTLASVEHAARTVDRELLAGVAAEMDPANPSGTLGKLHAAMDRVNRSLEDVNTMTAAGEQMVVLSRPAVERVLANFIGMSEALRQTSQEIQLNPSRLIWGPGRGRDEKVVVFQAASQFAEAATDLDSAAARLQAVLQTLPAEGASQVARKELEAVFAGVRAAFQRFERAEEVLWEQMK